MKIDQIKIKNFRGVGEEISIKLRNYNCIVGKNDVGKSTILKAFDLFLNDKNPALEDKNIYSDENNIYMEFSLLCDNTEIIIDEAISTTLEDEGLLSEDHLLILRKTWDTTKATIKAEWSIFRKKYEENDPLLLKQDELIKLCEKLEIETKRANGEEYNNAEKRTKIREYCDKNGIVSSYEYLSLPNTGKGRDKIILDEIKKMLPRLEYFKADTPLSETENSIQKYFREKALSLIKSSYPTEDIEEKIKNEVAAALNSITEKINAVIPEEEVVEAKVDFDWSKLITTKFVCKKEDKDIPFNSRGDGFRRLTMISYFEMLAEEDDDNRNIIYGFEEPETFLHPEMQNKLSDNLIDISKNGSQVLVTTHSAIFLGNASEENVIFITRGSENNYRVNQGGNTNLKTIIEELGIRSDDAIISEIDGIKAFLIVEGKDDVMAYNHVADIYKKSGKIKQTFEEANIHLLPIGGCDNIQAWVNLNVIKRLNKPFIVILDSDKKSEDDVSSNEIKLIKFGLNKDQYILTRKREIENYIPCSYFTNKYPNLKIFYGDWDDMKKIGSEYKLGGKYICEKHFHNLTYEQLQETFNPSEMDDEFMEIYEKVMKVIEN